MKKKQLKYKKEEEVDTMANRLGQGLKSHSKSLLCVAG